MTQKCKRCGKIIHADEKMYTLETVESTADYIIEKGATYLCKDCYETLKRFMYAKRTVDGACKAGFSVDVETSDADKRMFENN